MMRRDGVLVFIVVAIVLWVSWMFRYDLQGGHTKPIAYVLDRWTGKVELIWRSEIIPTTRPIIKTGKTSSNDEKAEEIDWSQYTPVE